MNRRISLFLLLAFVFLAGCTPIAATQIKAKFVLPKGWRILVFVDDRPGYGVPLDIPQNLATDLTTHLYQFKCTDPGFLVSPDKVTLLKQNPKAFERTDIMTVAQETGADAVVFVDVWQFDVQSSSDGMLTGGTAQALVRVVDREGRRMWPQGEPFSIDAAVEPGMTDDRDQLAVRKKLIEDLTVKVGRLFHDYASDNKYLAR